MDLLEYIKLYHNGKQVEFAKVAGLDVATISRLCNKKSYPNRTTMSKIMKATNGKVKLFDLIDGSAI